ncbi:MAG: type II toxin-antitoxin system RelE/ParE family toxin [Planctomycetota bacterium]|nr:MAG: type II toxin-antitoxin system RelE/ParE family toxin [Planctomycetota bacterium]REJ97898.1 MAG: type II toxin-antitoxin system RelE/ParE family toxin [Planctomycetota bacterium]REK25631.1 MAG: type II toxin-antitoxin system RelE/ParE family toxin [Planctomycetota bacterium]REK31658.1 MAG: type II toxin-antitoxin system RelE/ParE family toxin [Planctomycetota bacterium]
MKSFRFHPDARTELREAVRYLESQQSRLGRRFRALVGDALQVIRANPQTGILDGGFRLKSVRPFSYWVVFVERTDDIWIIAVHHGHRDHTYWQKRFDKLASEEG